MISNKDFQLKKITLICSRKVLKRRISSDIAKGKRDIECLERSLKYFDLYEDMDTEKIDTSEMATEEIVEEVMKLIE